MFSYRIKRAAVVVALLLTFMQMPCRSNAQVLNPAVQQIGSLFSIGGYFFTSGSARAAFGSTKFYSEASYFGSPTNLGALEVSGGVQIVGASDHFFPFTGGSRLSLYGPSVRFSTSHLRNRLRLSLTTGYYVTSISTISGHNVTTLAPSFEIGLSQPLVRYVTLIGGYRFGANVDHIDTSGFYFGLRLF